MADTHQLLDSWYEIWFGPEDNRRHFKRLDEESMADEVNQLKEMRRQAADHAENHPDLNARQAAQHQIEALVNIEVTKFSVSRELISEGE